MHNLVDKQPRRRSADMGTHSTGELFYPAQQPFEL
jgi:hypothetical protein